MRSVFSFVTPSTRRSGPPPPPSDSPLLRALQAAEPLVAKWDPASDHSFARVTSLFHHSPPEAAAFLRATRRLHSDLHASLLAPPHLLLRAQSLLSAALRRLEREFYQILAAHRASPDLDSLSSRASTSDFEDDTSDDDAAARPAPASTSSGSSHRVSLEATADLRAIADCMIATGYGRECVKAYTTVRKSVVDEGLFHLGLDRGSAPRLSGVGWGAAELKIGSWLRGVGTAVKSLLRRERMLCDDVFPSSDTIRESCFADVAGGGAAALLRFPQLMAKLKKTPEKIFRMLDLYEALAELLPDIESVFCFESTAAVRSQAAASLADLHGSIRAMLNDFGAEIQKDASKTPARDGGLHPLTKRVMRYLGRLSDYSRAVADVVEDWPLKVKSPLPESYLDGITSDSGKPSAISVRLAWLLLLLICKLGGKSKHFKDASLAYIFFANNLHYVVGKARSSNLRFLLGDEWLEKQEAKVGHYAENYLVMGWRRVLETLPASPAAEMPQAEAAGRLQRFCTAFEEECVKQGSWVVADRKLREELKGGVARKVVPAYRDFYDKFGAEFGVEARAESRPRFSPDDLRTYISDLFRGTGDVSPGNSAPPSPPSRSLFGRRTR